MKSLILFSLATVAVCASSDEPTASDFPSCSINCFTSLLSEDGCDEEDFNCHCRLPTLYANMAACVNTACDAEDADVFLNGFVASCKVLGVNMEGAPATPLVPTGTSGTASATAESGASKLVVTAMGSLVAGLVALSMF